jgi:hypothetical protein
MAAVTFENGRDFGDALIDGGRLSAISVANYLKLISANPIGLGEVLGGRWGGRDDFTPDEHRRILVAARHADPVIYWCNWLASFHGTRLSEITDIDTREFVEIDGIWVMQIRRISLEGCAAQDQGINPHGAAARGGVERGLLRI